VAPIVYLVGTPGHPHYGDEVVTAGWLRYYADVLPDAEVWLDSPRPGQTAVLHGGTHPRLRCVDTLYHACWHAPSERAEDCRTFGAEVIDNPGRLAREASGFTAASQAALVHVMGGSYLSGLWPRHLTLLAAARRIAERGVARLALTGADFAPVASDAPPVMRELLAGFDVVDVRTRASGELLAPAVEATVTGDDALLDLQRQTIDARARASTVVEIQNDLLEVPLEQLAAQAVRLLHAWGVADEPVLLLESLPPGDFDVLPLLREHLPRLETKPFELLWRDGFPVLPGRRWITTRFHSHLIAAATGTWGVALAGSPVLAAQHESLLELGTGWTLSRDPSDDVPAGHATSRPYDGRFGDLTAAKKAVADHVVAGVAG
jgi:hypothetical protein